MIPLISNTELTTATPLGGNIDIDRYSFSILDVQNSKIKELLGDSLYTKIETDYQAEDLSGLYLTLYNEFVKPIIIHESAAEYLIIGSYQVSNGGIYKHTPANGTPIESAEIDRLVNNQRTKAEMYCERLQRWLFRNLASIPEYTYHYENIVNPMPKNGGLNFDIISNTNRLWEKKPDNRMDDLFIK